ncbi:MAG: protein phosphatase 2C domain-containing protein [Chloroflexota bacterium]|nr:protein phosphatase 2C domain-containing protein [Chloroflexota bacterium]
MQVCSRALWLPKAGNTAEEYEDACAPLRSVRRELRAFRCAVADGATEASFSASWARLLVGAYCKGQWGGRRPFRSLARLQTVWQQEVDSLQLPWYAEEKRRSGAFASLLGFTLVAPSEENAGSWMAEAVGDSCLFQVRSDEVITAFPMSCAAAFNSRPHLIGSIAASNQQLLEHVRTARGGWEPGDIFYLMTDALACWFLIMVEGGTRPWLELTTAAADGQPSFAAWIEHLREEQAIRNDDVTLLQVNVR